MTWITIQIVTRQIISLAWAQGAQVALLGEESAPPTNPDAVVVPTPDTPSKALPDAAFGTTVSPADSTANIKLPRPTFGPAGASALPASPDLGASQAPGATAVPVGMSSGASAQLPGKPERRRAPLPPAPPANPYGHEINLTVNIDFFGRDLGEIPLHLDLAGDVTLNSAAIMQAFRPLLTEQAFQKLNTALADRPNIKLADLHDLGIDAEFDRSNVMVTVARIEPALRKPLPIYQTSVDRNAEEVNAFPSKFSGYLNVSVAQSRLWNGLRPGFQDPSIFLTSAIRAGPIVLEGQGQFADRSPGFINQDFNFDRNFVRLVYDLPKAYTRLYVGDLTPETRFQQSYAQMGGIGLSRQKRRFDQFRSAVLQGNRQLLLQRESTVDVYRNGVLYQQLHLAPGAYDISSLPLTTGSNDISLKVLGLDGTSQTIQYQAYFDPIDLDPGDYEIGAYVGKMTTSFGLSPKYDGELAFTGFFRKAFINSPAIGVGVQATKSVQQFSAQTQVLLGWGGRLDVTGAVSRSKAGTGYLAGVSYDLALDKSDRADTVSIQALYQSRYFTGITSPFQDNTNEFNLTATYTHTFNPDVSMQFGGNYVRNRRPMRDDYRLYADAYYRLSRKWSVNGGVDYQHRGQSTISPRQNGFGFRVALVFRPNDEDRLEARYDYRSDRAELTYDHSPGNYVGAVGYGGVVSRIPGQTAASGAVNYIANRFDVGLSHSMVGADFGGITDRQITTLRVGTAIAFADGAFALGRRVGDSFAILSPHRTLKGRSVISGQNLEGGHYRGKSGTFGGAVNGYLSSYITQSVQYDVLDPPVGYDVGSGVFRVRPPYHSGYHLVVGSDAFITATGTLTDAKGAPVKLASGQVLELSDPKAKATGFFTSSAGRFALAALKPNGRYRVQLNSGQAFEFTVPADIDGIFDMRTIQLTLPK